MAGKWVGSRSTKRTSSSGKSPPVAAERNAGASRESVSAVVANVVPPAGGRGERRCTGVEEAPDQIKKGWFERSTYGEREHRDITFC